MKILILAESASNPRSFPEKDKTYLEETYPYILREGFKDSIFWQLSFGNITSEELCSQAIGYLSHWNPDVIIVHSGLNDCRPEPMSNFQKDLFNFLSFGLINRVGLIKRLIYNPFLIQRRNKSRVTKKSFIKTLKRFKLIFSKSKIYWLEIGAKEDYEKDRPGFKKKSVEYNQLIHQVFHEDMIMIMDEINKVNGFNTDNLHWRKGAHNVVAEILKKRIKNDFKEYS
jgi:hypothetical protein